MQADAARSAHNFRILMWPYLAANEPLIGILSTRLDTTFRTKHMVVGITPARLILVPVTDDHIATGQPVSVLPADVVRSQVRYPKVHQFGDDPDYGRRRYLEVRLRTRLGTYHLMPRGTSPQLFGEGTQELGFARLTEFLAAAPGARPPKLP
jgi:hypothetical protein